MTTPAFTAAEKEAIMAARGQSSIKATGARKYDIHLADGRVWTCIDLVGDQPDVVERGIREMFGKYGIARIARPPDL